MQWLQTDEEKAEVRAAFVSEVLQMQESLGSPPAPASSSAPSGGMAIRRPRKVRRIDSDAVRFAESLSFQSSPAAPQQVQLQVLAQQSVESYLAEPGLGAFDDPLAWWRNTGKEKFPLLVPAVRKYLGTTGSSAKVERLWSSGRYLLEYFRSSLDGALAGSILQLRENMQLLGMWQDDKADAESSEDEADDWVDGPISDSA